MIRGVTGSVREKNEISILRPFKSFSNLCIIYFSIFHDFMAYVGFCCIEFFNQQPANQTELYFPGLIAPVGCCAVRTKKSRSQEI